MGGYLERLKTKKRLPQALPKLPKGENTTTPGTAKTAKSPFDSKDSRGGRHISETPPAPRQTVQERYNELWAEAWSLADYIDGESAPYADRKVRLPELNEMRAELAKLEKAGVQIPDGYK